MKSEFTREACDLQLKVGIMHVGAYDTNKQKLMCKERHSRYSELISCIVNLWLTLFYLCTQNNK